MKKNLFALLIVLIAVTFISCGEEEYSCDTGGICDSTGEDWEACCTSSDCYYKVGSKKFNCDGTDCEVAAGNLVAYCNGSGCTPDDVTELMSIVKEETR